MALKRWARLCLDMGWCPWGTDAPRTVFWRISYFALRMAASGVRATTAASYLRACRRVWRAVDFPVSGVDVERIVPLLNREAHTQSVQRGKLPVYPALLRRVAVVAVRNWPAAGSERTSLRRAAAAVAALVATAFLWRGADYGPAGAVRKDRYLRRRDLRLSDLRGTRGVTWHFGKDKTCQAGRARTRQIYATRGTHASGWCAATFVRAWLHSTANLAQAWSAAHSLPAPVFVYGLRRCDVTASTDVTALLREVQGGQADAVAKQWTAHSCRRGGATMLYAAGVALAEIAFAGRWASTTGALPIYVESDDVFGQDGSVADWRSRPGVRGRRVTFAPVGHHGGE